jgi:hypothetical protein
MSAGEAALRAKIRAFIDKDVKPMQGGSSACGATCIRLGDAAFTETMLLSILAGEYDPRDDAT